jgi:hypothetical protein
MKLRTEEGLKDLLEILGGDAATVIRETQFNTVTSQRAAYNKLPISSTISCITGLLPKGNIALGTVLVMGRYLLANPASVIIAFLTLLFAIISPFLVLGIYRTLIVLAMSINFNSLLPLAQKQHHLIKYTDSLQSEGKIVSGKNNEKHRRLYRSD